MPWIIWVDLICHGTKEEGNRYSKGAWREYPKLGHAYFKKVCFYDFAITFNRFAHFILCRSAMAWRLHFCYQFKGLCISCSNLVGRDFDDDNYRYAIYTDGKTKSCGFSSLWMREMSHYGTSTYQLDTSILMTFLSNIMIHNKLRFRHDIDKVIVTQICNYD